MCEIVYKRMKANTMWVNLEEGYSLVTDYVRGKGGLGELEG